MGLHFLGLTPIALLHAREAAGDGQAGRAVGRLCDGAGFRLRLDAVHRADPRRDPGGGGVRADGRARARACSRSIRSASAFRFCVAAFAVEPFAAFLARFRRHLASVEQAMGALLVLTGIAFLTGMHQPGRASGCWRRFRRWARSASSTPSAQRKKPAGDGGLFALSVERGLLRLAAIAAGHST